MHYNLVVMVDFGKKLAEYREHWKKTNAREFDSDFARWLGQKPTSVNNWIKSGYTPRDETIELLAHKIGPEVYSWAGRSSPEDAFSMLIAELPRDVVSEILKARKEYTAELSKRGITTDSPEGRQIIKSALIKALDRFADEIDIDIAL